MNSKYILLILFITTSLSALAQDPANLNVEVAKQEFKARQVVPPAPEAAELGKYGNTPVSLFTGTPQIGIPLYELKGRSLSLPVSLSYNASGFKPEDLPTWVGQGWSLNAGGVITRAIQGNPDNDDNYFGSNDNLIFPPYADRFAYYNFLHDAQIARRELEPDMYYYNFGNYSGKFLIQPDSTIVKKERDNLRIDQCITCSSSYINVTDEQGNKYEFTEVERTRMTLDDEASGEAPIYTTYTYPSAWYVSQITSADNREKLVFEYYFTVEHYLSKNMLSNKSITYTHSVTQTNPPTISDDVSSYTSTPPNVYTRRKFLKRISLLRDNLVVSYIDFESATGRLDAEVSDERYLQGIKVYSKVNNTDKLVKEFDFGYGYFSNTANTFKKYRLRLDTLTEIPVLTGTAAKPPYTFEYNTADASMPERYTASLDHWGFFNAVSNGSNLVPTVELNPGERYGGDANREPDFDGSAYGVLTKIKYPTRGYTAFEYELNTAKDRNNNLRNIGGIRVKRITDYSFTDRKATTKRYEYTREDGTTSGSSDPYYPKYIVETAYHRYPIPHIGNIPSLDEMGAQKITVSASSIFGLGSIKGSHIGYARVTEYLEDITNGVPLGKTVYTYHIGNRSQYDEDISNGDLETQSVYDGNGKLLQELTNTYSYKILGNIMGAKIKLESSQDNKYVYCKRLDEFGVPVYANYIDGVTITPACVEKRNYYTILRAENYTTYLQEKLLVKQTEKRYDQQSGNYLQNTRVNTYANPLHTFPTLVEDYTTGTEEVVTRKKYAGDYTLPTPGSALDDASGGISLLQNNNMLGAEIENIQYRQNQDGTNRRYINGLITVYDKTRPLPVSTYRMETATPPTTFTESSVNASGVFTKDSRYQPFARFDYGTSTNIREQSKVNDAPKSYIWDYNDGYPIAEVSNSAYRNILYTSFETDALGGWGTANTTINTTTAFTGKRSCNMGATGTISKLMVTPFDGQLILSYWAKSGALTVMQNGSSTIAAETGNATNGWTFYIHRMPDGTKQINISGPNNIVDELRLYPKDALMSSFTYDPEIGVTNTVSPANQMQAYEYDGLNRLINIKDEKGNIRQNFVYNYGTGATTIETPPQTLFYNSKKEQSFTKNNCTAGEPTAVMYTVNYGKYASAVSQQDADNKALAEITANGQNNANTNGQCLFFNEEKSQRFTRNNCPADQGLGMFYTYVVPARKWSSTINTQDANRLAQEDIDTNGQNAANQFGRCSCGAEGQKYVNGQCLTGTRINDSSTRLPDGTYKCTYHYDFSDGSSSQQYISYGSSPCPVI